MAPFSFKDIQTNAFQSSNERADANHLRANFSQLSTSSRAQGLRGISALSASVPHGRHQNHSMGLDDLNKGLQRQKEGQGGDSQLFFPFQSNSDYGKDLNGMGGPQFGASGRKPRLEIRDHHESGGSPDTLHARDPLGRLSTDSPPSTSRESVEQADDGFSAILRAARELKTTKLQLEEQGRHVVALESQLKTAKGDNDDLVRRIKTIKDAASAGYKKTAASLSELESSFKALKGQTAGFSSFVEQVQASLPDVQEMRATVLEATTTMEMFLEEEGCTTKTRHLLLEIQSDCSNSRQVTDFLRTRLTSQGAELAEARHRVTELERLPFEDKEGHKQTMRNLVIAQQQVAEMSGSLNEKRKELFKTLATTVELESKLFAQEEKITALTEDLRTKSDTLLEVPQLEDRIYRLEKQLTEAKHQAADAVRIREELASISNSLQTREKELAVVKAMLSEREEVYKDVKIGISKLETQLEESQRANAVLQQAASEAARREERSMQETLHANSQKATLEAQVAHLDSRFKEANSDLKQSREIFQQLKTEHNVLQERFDDQSVTLRATKDSMGDIQERMLSSETSFTREMEAMKGRHSSEVLLLKEQSTNLQARMNDQLVQIQRQEDAMRSLRFDYEKRLLDQASIEKTKLESEIERRNQIHVELKRQEDALREMQSEMSQKHHDLFEKDQEISRAAIKTGTKEKEMEMEIKNKEKEVSEKTAELRKVAEELLMKEQESSNLENELAKRTEEISAKEDEVARKELELADLRAELERSSQAISQRDQDLLQRDQALETRDQEIVQKTITLEKLEKQLETMVPAKDVEDKRLKDLEAQAEALVSENQGLLARSRDLSRRYKDGELNEEEKAFIANLITTSQSVHEQEVVLHGNEIRRRDNTIQSLQAKIKTLESTLKKHTNPQPKPPVSQVVPEKPSMINAAAWISSQQSSPPTNAPDRDAPSMNEDPAQFPKPESPTIKFATKPEVVSFTRLAATDRSDDIIDYDDVPLAKSTLGKRARMNGKGKEADVPGDADGGPPSRKLRASSKRDALKENDGAKPSEATVKARTRKRRV